MMERSPKLIWGVLALAIYFTLVGLLIFYFNTRHLDKSKHYVKKDEHRIQVALSSPQKEKVAKQKEKIKAKPKPKPKIKHKPKTKPKDTKKKVLKEKVVKKPVSKKHVIKKDENLTKKKKVKKNKPKPKPKTKPKKARDLFSNVKTKLLEITISDKPIKKKVKNNLIKVTDASPSAIARINESMKNKSSDSGVENAYFAKVQSMLESWPARSDFLGESATVTLYIKPTGMFEFQVTSGTNNEAFSRSVMDFLTQLQRIGFGRHNAGRTYEFEVEFSAKE